MTGVQTCALPISTQNNSELFYFHKKNSDSIQALSLRGDWKESENSEADSNFYQLLKLRCDEDPLINDWLQKKTSKFVSEDIQNEMLEIMALRVLREIAQNIQNALIYTIMADETADVSNKEHLVLCIRWVDDDLVAHKDFIGMHPLKDTDHNVFVIKDILQRMNLRLEDDWATVTMVRQPWQDLVLLV